jgi:Cu(I)/Ag(I) efflux system membrane protein CusA/SilA
VEKVFVKQGPNGIPILVKNVATVQLGGDIRRGLLEKNGEGEVVGGIVVMRSGANARDVIERVKQRIEEIKPGLPPGVEVVPSYDRSTLIEAAIGTLTVLLSRQALSLQLS